MPIASRTPEGWPNRCPLCGADLRIDPSNPPGDAPCPRCGQLLWFDDARNRVIDVIARTLHRQPSEIDLDKLFAQLGGDSLDVVEVIMALEEEFGEPLLDESERIRILTVRDLVDFLLRRLRRERE